MRNILFLLVFTYLFTACSKSKDSIPPSIMGKWNLTVSKGDFPTHNGIFPSGDITWTFQSNNALDVVTNTQLASEVPVLFHNTCTVNYSVNGSELIINNGKFGYYFENGKLNITQNHHACGSWYVFERD